MRRIVLFIFLVTLTMTGLHLGAVPQTDAAGDKLLAAAKHKARDDGDLTAAIEMFKQIAANAGTNRALAAEALLGAAECYETLGRPEAKATYESIVRDYATIGRAATAARTKLAAMEQRDRGLTTRRVWDKSGHSISPDGRYVAFFEDRDLAVHDLASGKNNLLTKSKPGSPTWGQWPVFSQDGRLIAYNWANAEKQFELRVIGRDGGEPRIAYVNKDETVESVLPLAWSRDGKWILAKLPKWSEAAGDYTRDFVWIPAAGGGTRLVKHFEADGRVPTPDLVYVSPDERFVAYDRLVSPSRSERRLFFASADNGPEVPMFATSANDRMLGWFPEGNRLLFLSDRGGTDGIWSVSVVDGRPQGEPMLIKSDTGSVWPLGFTRRGEFFYRAGRGADDIYLTSLDPGTGKQTAPLARVSSRYVGLNARAAWSPDGDRVIYAQSSRNFAILTVSTGVERIVQMELTGQYNPAWLADGRRVLFQGSDPQNPGDNYLRVLNADTGGFVPLGNDKPKGRWPTASRDGRQIFYVGSEGIVARDMASGAQRLVRTDRIPGGIQTIALSLDGQWLAVRSGLNGVGKLSIIPSTGGELRPLSTALNAWSLVGLAVEWSPDGRFVYVVKRSEPKADEALSEIWRIPVDGSDPQNTGITWAGGIARISANPDGRRLAVSTTSGANEIWALLNIPPQRAK